jgi:SAM-dependent methyltransferase
MPEIGENAAIWDGTWDWSDRGDEWSRWWGGTPALWNGGLLPRIHAFVPAPTVLEIAPGFGRWTQYLRQLADRLVIVDLAQQCIDSCRERFADAHNIEYHVNDGRSLEMVEDDSVDFAFSFDSLVHVESDVLDAYLEQLARKLKPDGVGFIHHSNVGTLRAAARLAHRTPERLRRRLVDRGLLLDIYAWRAESVTAAGFAARCEAVGLACIGQETISWEHGPFLMDCLSTFTPRGSRWDRPRVTTRNPFFGAEGRRMRRQYARSAFPDLDLPPK